MSSPSFASTPPAASDYRLVSGLFLRLLALVYLAAFASIGVQILGLAGSEGILPLQPHLEELRQQLGLARFWWSPSLCWLNSSDAALQGAAVAGCGFALLLFFRVLPRLSLVMLFLLYLSLLHAGQIFMEFQWDYLLLESGFLGIFLASGARSVVWLYRWLLFRLRFLSGAAKLLTQDPTWAGLTALNYYFETQPLPHWGSWYAQQLPEWLLRAGTGATLFIELVVPLMMWLPRRPRFIAAWATILMQVLIILTSNHNFFNFLTIALCLFLFDDRALARVVPAAAARWLSAGIRPAAGLKTRVSLRVLAGVIVLVSLAQIWTLFGAAQAPALAGDLVKLAGPLHVVNRYHVFPRMTTERIELVIEGSDDGVNWQAYAFRYQPGALTRRPPVVIPHQPRLDWMMWFVPLSYPYNMQWYDRFLERLLQGSAPVLDLLAANPFPNGPPRYVRANAYRYHFTDFETRAATGQWWTREYLGPFHPWPWLERPAP